MNRSLRVLASLFLALALVGAACSDDGESGDDGDGGGSTGDALKVGFVYVGPPGDAGWTKRHDDGRKALQDALGDDVETTFVANVDEGASSERVFEDLIREGNTLIFGTSFGYMDQMLALSEEHPDVCFQHVSGYKTSDNMGTIFGAAEEARYLSGIAAGHATENGKIGYVAAFGIPEVLRGINAFTLGAQSVNPDVTVQVVWTSTWFGPDVEKSAAEGLLDSGVDVVAMHQDTPSTGEAASAAGAKWVGYQDDMSEFAPDAWLTGAMWDWGPIYTEIAEAVADGDCPNDQFYGDMADGTVLLAPFGESVDEATRTEIETAKAGIIDGSLAPFTGPILDQNGTEVIPEGEVAPLEDLLGTDYLVQGVIGEIPEAE